MDYYLTMDFKVSMLSEKKQHFLLVLGLVLLVVGGGLILITTGVVPYRTALACTLSIVIGFLVNFGAYWRKRSSTWLFLGFMLVLSGVFFLVIKAAAPEIGLSRLWPFFMIFVGLSVFPAGFYKSRRARAAYIIPSVCFVLLGCFFLLFSLRIVSLSLRSFIYRLWPFFFIAAGVVILGMYIGNRLRFRRSADKEE